MPDGDHLLGFVRLTQHLEIPESLVTSEAARDMRTTYPADEVVVIETARSP